MRDAIYIYSIFHVVFHVCKVLKGTIYNVYGSLLTAITALHPFHLCKWHANVWLHISETEWIHTSFSRDVTKACSKLPSKSGVWTNTIKGLWIPMVYSALFYDWALDISLSQGDCVCTNKEADCSCRQWFIPLFCPPSAPDEKLIKTLSCLLIPSQTARANHLPWFTTFIFFFYEQHQS